MYIASRSPIGTVDNPKTGSRLKQKLKPDFVVMCFPLVQHFTLHDSAQLKEEKGMKQNKKKEFQENDIFFLQRELKRLYSI